MATANDKKLRVIAYGTWTGKRQFIVFLSIVLLSNWYEKSLFFFNRDIWIDYKPVTT